MLILPSPAIRKTHSCFLLFCLIIFSFSSFGDNNEYNKYYKVIYEFYGKERKCFMVSSSLELDISVNGSNATIFHPDKSHINNRLNWDSMVNSGQLSPGINFFDIKNKNGDGLKFRVNIKKNVAKKCHRDRSRYGYLYERCSDKKTKFMGALILDTSPIGKGLKFTGCTASNLNPGKHQCCLINISS